MNQRCYAFFFTLFCSQYAYAKSSTVNVPKPVVAVTVVDKTSGLSATHLAQSLRVAFQRQGHTLDAVHTYEQSLKIRSPYRPSASTKEDKRKASALLETCKELLSSRQLAPDSRTKIVDDCLKMLDESLWLVVDTKEGRQKVFDMCLFGTWNHLSAKAENVAKKKAMVCRSYASDAEVNPVLHPPTVAKLVQDVDQASLNGQGVETVIEATSSNCHALVNGVDRGQVPARIRTMRGLRYWVQLRCSPTQQADMLIAHPMLIDSNTPEPFHFRPAQSLMHALSTTEEFSLTYADPNAVQLRSFPDGLILADLAGWVSFWLLTAESNHVVRLEWVDVAERKIMATNRFSLTNGVLSASSEVDAGIALALSQQSNAEHQVHPTQAANLTADEDGLSLAAHPVNDQQKTSPLNYWIGAGLAAASIVPLISGFSTLATNGDCAAYDEWGRCKEVVDFGTGSKIALGVGALLLGTSAFFFIVRPIKTSSMTVSPSIDSKHASLVLHGTF